MSSFLDFICDCNHHTYTDDMHIYIYIYMFISFSSHAGISVHVQTCKYQVGPVGISICSHCVRDRIYNEITKNFFDGAGSVQTTSF